MVILQLVLLLFISHGRGVAKPRGEIKGTAWVGGERVLLVQQNIRVEPSPFLALHQHSVRRERVHIGLVAHTEHRVVHWHGTWHRGNYCMGCRCSLGAFITTAQEVVIVVRRVFALGRLDLLQESLWRGRGVHQTQRSDLSVRRRHARHFGGTNTGYGCLPGDKGWLWCRWCDPEINKETVTGRNLRQSQPMVYLLLFRGHVKGELTGTAAQAH